jgi:hypothetical protein
MRSSNPIDSHVQSSVQAVGIPLSDTWRYRRSCPVTIYQKWQSDTCSIISTNYRRFNAGDPYFRFKPSVWPDKLWTYGFQIIRQAPMFYFRLNICAWLLTPPIGGNDGTISVPFNAAAMSGLSLERQLTAR